MTVVLPRAWAHAPNSSLTGRSALQFLQDGTLTVPCIDFAEMRKRLGIPTGAKPLRWGVPSRIYCII